MTAGWTPAAMPVGATAPTNLEFDIASADRNDRMMLYSMLGVVGMTVAALGYAFLTKTKEPPAISAPPVIAAPSPPVQDMTPQQIYMQVDPNMNGFDQRTQWTPAPTQAPKPMEPVLTRPRPPQYTVSRVPGQRSKTAAVLDAVDSDE